MKVLPRLRAAAAGLLVLSLAACGTTVQQAGAPAAQTGAGLGGVTSLPTGVEGAAPAAVGPGATVRGDSVTTSSEAAARVTAGSLPAAQRQATSGRTAAGTVDRRPLTVGIVLTSTAGADTIGLKLDNTHSEQEFDDALIAALNAQGGLGGRRVVPVYATVDPLANDWSVDFAAACERFTVDHKVDVVLGYIFNYDPAFERCLARKGVPHLSTTFNVPDAEELRQFPLLLNVQNPTIERRTFAKVDGAVATGVLTPSSRVGVLNDDCPGTLRSYERNAVPFLARHRVKVVSTFTASCMSGQSDSGSSTAAVQSMTLQFKAADVTHVLFHAVSEGPAMAQMMQNAESQGWRPTYVMSSLANLMFASTNPQLVPPNQARNVKAFGWMPTEDMTVSNYPTANPAQQRCKALLKSRGVEPTSSLDHNIAYTMCEVLFLYQSALATTRGDSHGPAVVRAIQGLGRSFTSVSKLGGRAAFGPDRFDTVLEARPIVYTERCSCFLYTGALRPIPTS